MRWFLTLWLFWPGEVAVVEVELNIPICREAAGYWAAQFAADGAVTFYGGCVRRIDV